MRKDCEDTVFLSLTENWVGVVACCSCGRASVHHESLMIEQKPYELEVKDEKEE